MTPPNVSQLRALRSWRLWLLALVALVQGVQYVANPLFPYTTTSYAALQPVGLVGWQIIGAGFMAVGAWILFAPDEWDAPAHAVGLLLYLLLAGASVAAHVMPAVLLLPAALHGGEVALAVTVWLRGQRRRDG